MIDAKYVQHTNDLNVCMLSSQQCMDGTTQVKPFGVPSVGLDKVFSPIHGKKLPQFVISSKGIKREKESSQ